MKDLKYIVEGQFRAVPSDAALDNWKPVAAFKYEIDAKRYIRSQEEINGESAYVDRMWVRLVLAGGKP